MVMTVVVVVVVVAMQADAGEGRRRDGRRDRGVALPRDRQPAQHGHRWRVRNDRVQRDQ